MAQEKHPFTSNRWFENINNSSLQEKWFLNKNTFEETISFGYMPSKEVNSIFLGTFPIWEITIGPNERQNLEFFYGSIVNEFWNCLGFIFEMPINSLNNRLSILESFKFGITDILETVDRNPYNSNLDNNLRALNYNNIVNIKEFFPLVKNIFITSGGKGPVNNLTTRNQNAATWFKDSLREQDTSGFDSNGFVKTITINSIKFNLIYLFSPSNAANLSRKKEMNLNNDFGINNLSIQEYRKLQWAYFIKKYHLGEIRNETIDNFYNIVLNNQALLNYFNN